MQAYLSLATFRGEVPLEHWLARIATRVGYRFWRTVSRERSIHSVPVEDVVHLLAVDPEAIDPKVAADALFRLLERLPPRDRLVLSLRFVEDRSVEQTAQLMRWTQTMVKVQTWRARKKLKALFHESGLEVEP